ncbi:MAG: hemolysin family protein [Trueperaceae bacterium]
MSPRVDMVALRDDARLDELLTLATDHGYSRMPVYAGTIDDVRGVVHVRDLLPYLGRPDAFEGATVADLLAPAQYVPETQSILNLLRDMRARKQHVAIVVDEFGGTSGLVTLEDVIEEITGEIYDETDEEEDEDVVRSGDGTYLIQGSTHLDTVSDVLDGVMFNDAGEYDTLAGFLTDRFGSIPQVGEMLDYHGATFEVIEGDERRVTLVRVQLHHENRGESDDESAGRGDDADARYGEDPPEPGDGPTDERPPGDGTDADRNR